MSRSTRLFLLSGCCLVLFLELPRSASSVAAAWGGPYAARADAQRGAPAAVASDRSPLGPPELGLLVSGSRR